MNVFNIFNGKIKAIVEEVAGAGDLPAGLDLSRVSVEPPRDPSHGDIATNAAMVLAKPAKMKPRDIAALLAAKLEQDADVTSVDIAGPGFINLRLSDDYWHALLRQILSTADVFGRSEIGQGEKVNVEFVSANPTGPLHAAHARGAVFGDVLASLLDFAGYDVYREYYTNDAGAQVDTLARSAYLRYREALGEDIGEIPEGFYPGGYLKDVGKAFADQEGDKWMEAEEADWLPVLRPFAIAKLMDGVRGDLEALGIEMDRFSSERDLVTSGAVDAALKSLEDDGLIYTGVLEPPKGKKPEDWEPRPQTLFRATDFGDDVDRPLKKSDGSWTYFANDIAYHYDKHKRGFNDQIDVWGADHSGYIKRMQAAVRAITKEEGELDVKICQLVHLMDNGKPVKMSKRAGTFVTVRDVIDSVGKDVIRFIMLTRRNDQTLEFDFKKVTEQSRENPVFYVQYAHARGHSVLRAATEEFGDAGLSAAALADAAVERLTDPAELGLIKVLAGWPRLVESAALSHEPHRVAFYLGEVAAAFHGLWNKGKDNATLRFIADGDKELTLARLALVRATATVIASGLNMFGVDPVEELRS